MNAQQKDRLLGLTIEELTGMDCGVWIKKINDKNWLVEVICDDWSEKGFLNEYELESLEIFCRNTLSALTQSRLIKDKE